MWVFQLLFGVPDQKGVGLSAAVWGACPEVCGSFSCCLGCLTRRVWVFQLLFGVPDQKGVGLSAAVWGA